MRVCLGKRGWILLALTAGLSVAVLFLCLETVPKKDLTLTAISKLGVEIHNYYETNHHLPSNLNELTIGPEFRNDAWGRPIIYGEVTTTTYVLRSLGPNGRRDKDNIAFLFHAADLSGIPAP